MNSPIKKRNNNGTFLTGNNEGTGRPKGTPNKTTIRLKNTIILFLEDKFLELGDIWEDLDARDRAQMLIHLSKLVLPKTKEDPVREKDLIDFSGITTEEIKKLLNDETNS